MRRSAASGFLGSRIRIPLKAWMFVCSVSCMLCRFWSLRRTDHSYRGVLPVVCIIVFDQGTSHMAAQVRVGLLHHKKKSYLPTFCGPGYLICYGDSLSRIPVGARFSAPIQTGPGAHPASLYNGYRVSFPGVKLSGRGVEHPPPSSAEVKETVQLYLYPLSGPSWPVLGRTLLPTI